MDEHFAELFARYAEITPSPVCRPSAAGDFDQRPELALPRPVAAEG